MNAKTLKALRASIEHWKRLATGKRNRGEHLGSDNCALCNLFLSASPQRCRDCPVRKRTGQVLCYGTPYIKALTASLDKPKGLDSREFKLAAKEELAFLQSLLPKAAKQP